MDLSVETLPGLLEAITAEAGERIAVICEEERFTYQQISDLTDQISRALVAQGVGKGTRIALLMENVPEWIAFSFAAASLGAVVAPISTFARRDEIAYQLRHSDASQIYMTARFLKSNFQSMIEELLPELSTASQEPIYNSQLPALRKVIIKGADHLPDAADSWDDFVQSGKSVSMEIVRELRKEIDPEDECYLLYTSGTTASPKGVYHRQKSIVRNGILIGRYQQLVPEDVVWFYLPFFFSAGCINVLLGTFSNGAALILQPTFDAGAAINLIEREKATTWHLWPHQARAMREHPDWQTKDHSLLHKGTGAFDVILRVGKQFGGVGGVNMYGMTETCTAFTCTHADESEKIRIKTNGRVMEGSELKIVDSETGERVAQGETGEICVKGPSVMRRYYKVDPLTTFDVQGFLPTGDLGYLDEDDRLHFEQRKKDMIKSGGINISPADIESCLRKMEAVSEAYAFPLPGGSRGQLVGAALVLADESVSKDSIAQYCRDEFSTHKRPSSLLLIKKENLPMTGSGKVQKVKLAEMLTKSIEGSAEDCVLV